MSLKILERYRERIERALGDALQGDTRLRSILRYHVGLTDQEEHPADATGKLLRPSLVLFVAEQLSASIEQAMPAAIGLELIHNFSLIHDDIQDGDRTRRGRPTVWTLWGEREAINAGDLMHVLAVQEALRCGEVVADTLLTATDAMIEGQSLDLDFETRQITLAEYLDMIDRKTGALLRAAFELGGVVAGADAAVRRHLLDLGHAIGRAFQIQDDLLGVWGDTAVVGKPNGSDVRRRKKSYPVLLAFEQVGASELDTLRAIYARDDLNHEDAAWVIEQMDRLGIRDAGRAAVREHLTEASEALDALPFSGEGRADMAELIGYLERRNK